MKKRLALGLAVALLMSLCACGKPAEFDETAATTTPTTETTMPSAEPTVIPTTVPTAAPTELPTQAPTVAPTEIPTEAPTVVPTEAPTEAPHSELYIEGISVEQMITYFNEVVLHIEYSTGSGNSSLVQKWDRPIYYRIEGGPTQEDAAALNKVIKDLNTVEGFPGIYAATGLEQNLSISFLNQTELNDRFSSVVNGEAVDGAVQFWYYTATNNIYNGRIGYRKDISQKIRNSVIPEELVNLLGISDTVLRKDSITYQYGSEATKLSDVDWVILRLLYNPKIQCGMNAAQCEAVIRELYY